jgi:hypothetical protein
MVFVILRTHQKIPTTVFLLRYVRLVSHILVRIESNKCGRLTAEVNCVICFKCFVDILLLYCDSNKTAASCTIIMMDITWAMSLKHQASTVRIFLI